MERITLRIFFGCLVTCAALVIIGIWFGESGRVPPFIFQIAATAFVVGLGNFLTWVVCMTYRILVALEHA
jgi:hypothetical protein